MSNKLQLYKVELKRGWPEYLIGDSSLAFRDQGGYEEETARITLTDAGGTGSSWIVLEALTSVGYLHFDFVQRPSVHECVNICNY